MARRKSTVNKHRLSRDEWLSKALDSLAKEGGNVLTIDTLVKRLGVSRGSFYWHFKNRDDFVRQLVEYWSLNFTQNVTDEQIQLEGSAQERLMRLMTYIVRDNLARYDMAIRTWASYDPVAARSVKKIDNLRLDTVASLFSEMGFTGEELEMRTRTFVVYYSLESGLFAGISQKEQIEQVKLRHALLTQPLS